MKNLMEAWPRLQFIDEDSKHDVQLKRTATFWLSRWSNYTLGRHVPEETLMFMSVEDANKIVDSMHEVLLPGHRPWLKRVKEAINGS